MTATILLIRHGAHDRLGHVLCGRMDGVDLGEQGRRAAEVLARAIRSDPLAAVYAGPLSRARQTAAPLAAAYGLDVRVENDLDEIDVGAWTGRSFESLHDDAEWRRWNSDRPRARPPGGETLLEAQARIARFLCSMRDRHAGKRIAAVSHADPIRAGLAWCLGLPLDLAHRLEIGPASVSVVAIGDWGVKVHSVNAAPPEPVLP